MQNNEAMQAFVIDLLKKNIPAAYTYHNYLHTLYVQEKSKELALQEKLDENEMRLLNVAALWHDTGYINVYKGHEEESCNLATEYLPGYGFTENEIDKICGMIMATKIPQTAHTIAEKILADADLAYLGTIDAAEIAENLFKELNSRNAQLTKTEWQHQQINFLTSHQYFTDFYKKNYEPVKQRYLFQLQKR
ncbi:MAG: HD domain-containing protein [Chitinophagaceae bacterium]|nr:MAG: HD domain-containing protein [Chitinophagaceae bacterium]